MNNLIYIKSNYKTNYNSQSTISYTLLNNNEKKTSELSSENNYNTKIERIQNILEKTLNMFSIPFSIYENMSSIPFSIYETINKRKKSKAKKLLENTEIPEDREIQSENIKPDNSQRENDSYEIEQINSETQSKK